VRPLSERNADVAIFGSRILCNVRCGATWRATN
jgi:hypothetical protein